MDSASEGFALCLMIMIVALFGYLMGCAVVEQEIERCFSRNVPISECKKLNGWAFVSLVKDKDLTEKGE